MVDNYRALLSLLKFLFTHQDLDILQVRLPLVSLSILFLSLLCSPVHAAHLICIAD